jgi:hypothetical protein
MHGNILKNMRANRKRVGGMMASFVYYGHETMTYSQYIDTATGKTLVCAPGGTYSVIPAGGYTGSAMPNDGRFTAGRGMNVMEDAEEDVPADPGKKTKADTPDEG